MVSGYRREASAFTVTLSIAGEAAGALDAYLRSGAATGQPFEHALRQALAARQDAPSRVASGRQGLSRRSLRQVREFVAANLSRDITVGDIAGAACVSVFHLGRGFRQATGQSLWQYVLACRAEFADRLIAQQPGTPLAEIALMSGFQSYSQFIAAFRKAHGVTPSARREALARAAA